MKKLLLVLTLVICLAVSMVVFTSCGGNGDECEHTWATVATIDKGASCTADGSKSIKCTICGEIDADSVTVIPATGHDYVTESYTAATCVTDGSETKLCTICADTTTTTLPATGEHAWAPIPTVDVEATCESDGSESIKCRDCQAVKPDSTTVVPAGHLWDFIATVDTPATCTTNGEKSLKCLLCKVKKEGSEVVIPATGHTGLNVTVVPTFFSEGVADGTCTTCGNEGVASVPKTLTEAYKFTSSTGDKFYTQMHINADILDGDHFYPTEDNEAGKDLYVEFSFLYNPTLHNYNNGVGNHYFYFGMFENAAADGKRRTAFHLLVRESPKADFWCEHIGGFEPHYNGDKVTYGPSMQDGGKVTDFPNIGDYGWHRIGLQYHQTTKNVNGTAKHSIEVTMYIDGVKVSSYYTVKDEGNSYPNLLYTAEYVNGQLVYTGDSGDETYMFPYMIGDAEANADTNMYFIIADLYVTAGNGFVMDVEKVENPADATYSPEDGTDLDGKIFFQLKTAE